jgi:hypothetical protein
MVQRKGLLKRHREDITKTGPRNRVNLTGTIGKKSKWFSENTNSQSMTLFTRNDMGLLNHRSGFLKTSGPGKRDNFENVWQIER